ncbi:MAG: hypothetical protein V1793_06520 [Pseudomonadota bacterium]
MRSINFTAAEPGAFINALEHVRGQADKPVWIVGSGDLAHQTASQAEKLGIPHILSGEPDPKDLSDVSSVIMTETQGEALSRQLMTYVPLSHARIIAPVTDWHYSRKALFIVSIPKAGTHLVHRLAEAMGYGIGGSAPDFPMGKTWYCLEYSNSHTHARDFFVDTVKRSPFGNRHHRFAQSPVLFCYRHPLDILVSEANYYHCDGKTAFSGWLNRYDFKDRLNRLMGDNWLLGSLRERIGPYLPWLEFPNVIAFSFEEIVGAAGGGNQDDQLELIWSLQLKLQAPGNPEDIASRLFNPDSPTFRTGKINQYSEVIPQDTIRGFADRNTDILESFGYARDGSFGMPAGRSGRRRNPVAYSGFDCDSIPIRVEADFHGCNLVRYNRRIYAIPVSAGDVSLSRMSGKDLELLPSAATVSDMKLLLTTGLETFIRQREEIESFGRIMAKNRIPRCHRYWARNDTPVIHETYKGYNLVEVGSRYLALEQSIGEVDPGEHSPDDLVQRHGENSVLIGAAISDLRRQIDICLLKKRLTSEQADGLARLYESILQQCRELIGACDKKRMESFEDLVEQIHDLKKDELESTEKMLRLLAETKQASDQTVSRLAIIEDNDRNRKDDELRLLEDRLSTVSARCLDLENQLADLKGNWLVRAADGLRTLIRGRRKT